MAITVLAFVVALELSVALRGGNLVLAAITGLGVGLGLLVHEWGHASALLGRPAALVIAGRRTFVLHGKLEPTRGALVAAAGPGAAAALGTLVLAASDLAGILQLVPLGGALAAHAAGLTVVAGDGRAACGLDL